MYYYLGEMDKAIEHHLNALKLREESGDKKLAVLTEGHIGNVLFQKGEFDKALEIFLKISNVYEEMGNKFFLAKSLSNAGLVYQQKGQYDKALKFLVDGLKLREEIGDQSGIAISYSNIGINYNLTNDFLKAESYLLKAIVIMNRIGDKASLSNTYNNLGDLYYKFKKYDEAKKMQLTSLKIASEIHSKPTLLYTYASLIKCDSALGDFKEAYEYQRQYIITKDSVFREESDKRMQEMQTKYETEKKETEIQLLTKDSELQKSKVKTQRIVIGSIIAGLIIMIALAFFIFNRLQITRKQKRIIEEQKKLVDIKNMHITDSITYAKRIQDAILPSNEELASYFSDYFILFQPRDIVSGDFYWVSVINNQILFVVADCTGHGVPGAFMSMIGNTLLNKIINEQGIHQPSEILKQLNEGIYNALHKNSHSQDDGMDASICLINPTERKIIFAGANHSMYIVTSGILKEIDGNPYSIGSSYINQRSTFSFEQVEVIVPENTYIYFSTDGFPDQLGGENKKRFLSSNLKKLFANMYNLPLNAQEEKIRKTFMDWKGKRDQLDDVLVVGIKL